MDSLGKPLITDFGCSRMLSYSQTIMKTTTTDRVRGSLRWMAYELVSDEEEELKHTKASDVWAYGMTLYVSSDHACG